jgi:hypothetical protein
MTSSLRLLLAVAGLTAACGAVSTPTGADVSPSPTPAVATPAVPRQLVLTQPDAGRPVTVHRGDTVEVSLEDSKPVPGSSLIWNVTSSDAGVLQPGAVHRSLPPGAVTGHGTYTADFTAVAPGQARLVATGQRKCEAMADASCPPQQLVFPVGVM